MTASASYRPGEWFGVFGEQATVVLPPSEKARVGRIWAMVDDGAGFDEVLDALVSDGLRQLPGFVLVSESEGETKVVIRGPARAEFTTDDDLVTVEGSAATTWAERSLREVRSMRIGVAEGDGTEDLPIREGLVRVARIDRPAVRSAVAEPAVAEPVAAEPGTTGDEIAAAETAGEETAYYPAPGRGPADPLAEQRDDLTWAAGVGAGAESPARSDLSSVPFGAGPLTSPVARLKFSSGEVVGVDGAVVVGRAPEARRSTSSQTPRLVTVPSPRQEISSTHVEIRPGAGADHGSAVVVDLGSTNGTVLQQPGLPPEDLTPGVAVQLLPGAVIDLGDGVTIEVTGVSHP